MRVYVGITDREWAAQLASVGAAEVNFWRPAGDRVFRAIQPGDVFLFKLHAPDNRVVGGGIYNGFAGLTLTEAWRFYGEANGARTLEEMRARIAQYRRSLIDPYEDPRIGCVLLNEVRFLAPENWAPPPPDFAPSIVQGKTYDATAVGYRDYFAHVLPLIFSGASQTRLDIGWHDLGPVFGDPHLAPTRLGQRAFKAVVLNSYGGRCAITGDKIRPVLEAAHIRPVTEGGENRVDNGLLFRSDVHTLFDAGYLGVDPSYRLLVSPRLRREFGNGDEFYDRAAAGEPISLPHRRVDRPNREFLEWHLDERFLSA